MYNVDEGMMYFNQQGILVLSRIKFDKCLNGMTYLHDLKLTLKPPESKSSESFYYDYKLFFT